MVIEAKALAQKRATDGYTYQQERDFEVAETAAANEGTGQLYNLEIRFGIMAGVGGAVGNMVGGAVTDAFSGIQPWLQHNTY